MRWGWNLALSLSGPLLGLLWAWNPWRGLVDWTLLALIIGQALLLYLALVLLY